MSCSVRNQRGFMLYAAIGALIVFSLMLAYIHVLRGSLARCEQEFAGFKAQVEANGKAAEAEAKRKNAENAAKKEKIDNENRKLRADNSALVKRLRDNRPAGGGVPAAPAGSSRPDLACYDRAEFVRADGELVKRLRGLADEGTESAIDLNSAREWARNR